MTQIGKCMTCRQRKVKCDEQYPKCGQCRKRNRACQYPSGNVRRLHVTLVERPTREGSKTGLSTSNDGSTTASPESGDSPGLPVETPTFLHTLPSNQTSNHDWNTSQPIPHAHDDASWSRDAGSETKVPCEWRSLQGPEQPTKARFIAMLDEEPFDINISYLWGGWLRLVAARIGCNKVLDDAMLCCVAGMVVHHDRSLQNLVVASRTYGKALTSIQRALTDHSSTNVYSSDTITASKYLTAFETLLDLNGDLWERHWRGLEKLLASRGCHDEDDDLLKSLYYQILGHYFNGAASEGRDCTFDSPDWLNCSPPPFPNESTEFHVMYKKLMQLIVPMARLIRLVRLVKSNVAGPNDVDEAVNLAKRLYQINLDRFFSNRAGDNLSCVRTMDESLADYFPESIAYRTTPIFEAQMRYCFCRIIVIGLCKVLHALGLFASHRDVLVMTEQELTCAKTIAMSVQYAGRIEHQIPIGSLLAMGPLQAAAGTWYRWQRHRDLAQDSSPRDHMDMDMDMDIDMNMESAKAQFMMHWCREKSNAMVKSWNGPRMSHDMLKVQVSVLEGGPLEAWTGRRLFPL